MLALLAVAVVVATVGARHVALGRDMDVKAHGWLPMF